MKNSGVAAVLSFFIYGLGQIYNGQILKGLIMMGCYFVSWLWVYVLIVFIIVPTLWIWGIYNACQTAERMNKQNTSGM